MQLFESHEFIGLSCNAVRSHNLEHDSIASVRVEDESGRFHTLSGKEIQAQQGHCLIRVPTVSPVLDQHWFLEQIARARERHAVEMPTF